MTKTRDTSIGLEDAAQAFAALGSRQRLSIMQKLVRSGPEGISIGDLGSATGITGATLNHHLRALVAAGLVTQVKAGRSIINAPEYARVHSLSAYLLSECCADVPRDQRVEGHSHD